LEVVMARLLVAPLLGVLIAAAGAAPARAADASSERLVVRFADSASAGERTAARRDAGARVMHAVPALDDVQVVSVPAGRAAQAAAALERSDDVLWAGTDERVRATAALPAGNDSRSGGQWGLLNTGQWIFGQYGLAGIDGGFTRAWDTTLGDPSQAIAVVDTGVDFSLADLSVNQHAGGHDWIDGDDDPSPGPAGARLPADASHGTHVAGIAAASLGVHQSRGDIAGGAPSAGIVALRVLDADGYGWSSDIAAAFAWAADHGVRVVNASLSGVGRSQAIADAIATHPDTLFVVAAGNGDSRGVGYDEDARAAADRDFPCANPSPNVVCVAAVDNRGGLAGFSNYGATSVDVGAPGVDVLSYVRGGALQYWDGTSMATPYAAAAAALAFAQHPDASAAQVRVAMLAGARPLPSLAGRTVAGGMVDAAGLLAELGTHAAPALRTAVSLQAGTPTVGRPLSASGGTFDDGAVTWSWERCDGGCTVIAGAQAPTYTPTAADIGRRLRATAMATTSGGSLSSHSELSDPVADVAQGAPSSPPSSKTPDPPVVHPPAAPALTMRPLVSQNWRTAGSRFTLRGLGVSRLPRGSVVQIGCKGRRCPLRSKRVTASRSSVDLLRALGKHRSFRAGQTLELRISAPGYETAVVRFVLKRGKRPRAQTV
jgi:hypothetical protein